MANNPKLTGDAVNETLDVKIAATDLVNLINGVLEDGMVTPEEAAIVRRQARRVLNEADEAVEATRDADIGLRLAVSYLTTKPVNTSLQREAREAGFPILVMTGSTERHGTEAA